MQSPKIHIASNTMKQPYLLCLVLCGLFSPAVHANKHHWGTDEERKAILEEAITEAKLTSELQSQPAGSRPSLSAILLAKGFKKASKSALKQGRARLLMEDMVRRAERKLSELKRKQYVGSDAEAKAEDLATELFHKPGSLLTTEELARINIESECHHIIAKPTTCNQSAILTFRTFDGTCNNLQDFRRGAAQTAFRRLIPAAYEDGIAAPLGRMQTVSGGMMRIGPYDPPKPSARLVSLSIVKDRVIEETSFTHVLMQWGQFLDHDLDLGPEDEEECRTCAITATCEPIRIPNDDPAFSNGRGSTNDGQCLSFKRSIPACEGLDGDTFSVRNQLNDLTSYIDGSQIYGSSSQTAMMLRNSTHSEFMNVSSNNNLPVNSDGSFIAGDIRVNEQIGLTSMHTLWVREHNRIAKQLKSLNSHWSSERTFQEARKIVGAILQKITYSDFLPKILGRRLFNQLIGSRSRYNITVDASVPNSFATAAFRFGHSLIRPVFSRFLSDQYETGINMPIGLRTMFFNTTAFLETEIDAILRGLVTQNSLKMDEFLNAVLTTQLFQRPDTHGMDLAALNIQRQRDHGMPSYTVWRNFCRRTFPFLPMPDVENDLTFIRFMQNYGAMSNIDLWLGGISEQRLPQSLLGPTFACIFGLTFRNLRDGDRFWYKNPGVFTRQQQRQIQRATLSKVICENTGINSIQRDAFSSKQKRVSCNSLPSLNLRMWRERPCYLRIQSTRGRITVQYRSDGVLHRSTRRRRGCAVIECPSSLNNEQIDVFPTRQRDRSRCSAKINDKLPNDEFPSVKWRYRGSSLSESLIDSSSGIYSSRRSCNRGGSFAVMFNCNHEAEDIDDVDDKEINDVDDEEIDNKQEENDDCSSPSSIDCDIPADALEEEIAFLKSIQSKETESVNDPDHEETKVESDEELYNELEDTLKKLNDH